MNAMEQETIKVKEALQRVQLHWIKMKLFKYMSEVRIIPSMEEVKEVLCGTRHQIVVVLLMIMCILTMVVVRQMCVSQQKRILD